jgi:hypothetical protein
MQTETLWNSLEVAKLVISILTPLVVAFVGYWITTRLKKIELTTQAELEKDREERMQLYEERKEVERLEREERKSQIERRYTPHIELRIESQFFGPRKDQFLVVFSLIANNRGHVVHEFPSVDLRVRGIKDEPFQYWKGWEPRAHFPHKLFEVDLVPPDWEFIFIEPSVSHQITFTTIVPADYSYLLAYAEFEYKKYWPHSAETLFAVPKHSA